MYKLLTCLVAILIANPASAELLNIDLNCMGKMKIRSSVFGSNDWFDEGVQDWNKQISIKNNEYEGRKLTVSEFKIEAREGYGGGFTYIFVLDRHTGKLSNIYFGKKEPFDYFFEVTASCELMDTKTRKF